MNNNENAGSHLAAIRRAVGDVLGKPAECYGTADGLDQTDGWDSLAQMTILLAVEKNLGIEFTADELLEVRSIQAMLNAVSLRTDDIPPGNEAQ